MIITRIRAINNSSLGDFRKVMVLEEWGPRHTIHGELHLTKGTEAELPKWLANELQRAGIVKVIDTLTVDDLGRIIFQEKQKANVPASLTKTDERLYQKVNELVASLREKNDIESLEQVKKVISMAAEISSLRIRKVIQLSFLGINDEKVNDKMTEEELLIFHTIREILRFISGEIHGKTT